MINTKVVITLILILTGLLDVIVFNATIKRSITRPLVRLKSTMTKIGTLPMHMTAPNIKPKAAPTAC